MVVDVDVDEDAADARAARVDARNVIHGLGRYRACMGQHFYCDLNLSSLGDSLAFDGMLTGHYHHVARNVLSVSSSSSYFIE
jgi:hypothetical protein